MFNVERAHNEMQSVLSALTVQSYKRRESTVFSTQTRNLPEEGQIRHVRTCRMLAGSFPAPIFTGFTQKSKDKYPCTSLESSLLSRLREGFSAPGEDARPCCFQDKPQQTTIENKSYIWDMKWPERSKYLFQIFIQGETPEIWQPKQDPQSPAEWQNMDQWGYQLLLMKWHLHDFKKQNHQKMASCVCRVSAGFCVAVTDYFPALLYCTKSCTERRLWNGSMSFIKCQTGPASILSWS